jgi:S1-C subfamily serine protease
MSSEKLAEPVIKSEKAGSVDTVREADMPYQPHLDPEWQVRHEHQPKVRSSNGGTTRRLTLFVLFVVATLLISMTGGVIGFVSLSNSDSPIARQVRSSLGLDASDSQLRVPVRQDVQLNESSAFIEAAKKVGPAVVAVTTTGQVTNIFGQVSTQKTGSGSGFILTSDGLIVTNKHVVEAAGQTYSVVLSDGRTFDAKVQATDPFNDLAVLKIDAKDLPTVELGSSDDLQVGQFVLAVGNALGEFQNSVTLGVVSAKNRQLSDVGGQGGSSSGEDLSDLIQTDAAINPGNSGGPLVNSIGQVVGINSAIASPTGSSVGIGFSISIDSVRSVLDAVRRTGKIVRPRLGVRYAPNSAAIQKQNDFAVDYGVIVSRGRLLTDLAVLPSSPADKVGIKEGDIITEIDGRRIDEKNSLVKILSGKNVGDTIELTYYRGKESAKVKVELEGL